MARVADRVERAACDVHAVVAVGRRVVPPLGDPARGVADHSVDRAGLRVPRDTPAARQLQRGREVDRCVDVAFKGDRVRRGGVRALRIESADDKRVVPSVGECPDLDHRDHPRPPVRLADEQQPRVLTIEHGEIPRDRDADPQRVLGERPLGRVDHAVEGGHRDAEHHDDQRHDDDQFDQRERPMGRVHCLCVDVSVPHRPTPTTLSVLASAR